MLTRLLAAHVTNTVAPEPHPAPPSRKPTETHRNPQLTARAGCAHSAGMRMSLASADSALEVG